MSSSEGGHTITVILQPAQFGALIDRARRAGLTPGQAAHAAVMASLGPRLVSPAVPASGQSDEWRERCADAEAKVRSLTAKLEARDGQVRQMEAGMAELRKEAKRLQHECNRTQSECDAALAGLIARRNETDAMITALRAECDQANADAELWRKTAERENDALAAKMAEAAKLNDDRAALEDQVDQLRSRLVEMEVALAAPIKIAQSGKLTGMLDDEEPAGQPLRSPLSDEEVRLVRAYRFAGWTASSICREMNISLFAVDAALGRK